MKKFIFAVMALMFSGTALAQLSGNAAVTSDYRFRGISQTQNALAVQGGMTPITRHQHLASGFRECTFIYIK